MSRVIPAVLLGCVFTLHWAVAQAPAPGAPAGLAAAGGNGSITLTWEDPGDAAITGYEYRVHADREQDWRAWKEITDSTPETVSHTLSGLTNGVGYQVQVRARNSDGTGEASEAAATPQAPAAEAAMAVDAPPADAPPGAPAGLAAAGGNGSITLTWEDPGDATITGYEYRVHADREQDWREWKAITGTTHVTTAYTLDLTNGVSYRVQVRARNSAGAGEASEAAAMPQAPAAEGTEEAAMAVDAPPADAPPGAPAGLAAAGGNGSITLTWEDPGDATITGYEYRVHADREQDWREWKAITGTTHVTTAYTLDLTNGVSYRVQVRARNSAGAGEASEAAAMPQAPAAEGTEEAAMAVDAPPADAPPGAPAGLAAAGGNGSITLTWEDPGDATITGYEYRVHADREQDWREWKAITGTTHVTTAYTLDLTNGVSYRVQVRARNSAGAGEASEAAAMPQAPAAEAVEGTTTDAPSGSGEAAEGSAEADAPAGEAPVDEVPQSGAPWIVIIVLAACLVIGIVIVVMRLRSAAGSADSQDDADSQDADS